MKETEFDILMRKVNNKFRESDVETNGDEMSLLSFYQHLLFALKEYNYVFNCSLNNYKKQLNRKIYLENIFGKKIPQIDGIFPNVFEDGSYRIDMIFKDNNCKYAGSATINESCDVGIYVNNKYSMSQTVDFINSVLGNFKYYLDYLEKFSIENPSVNYEWNMDSVEKRQKVNDGFLEALINLDRINEVCLSFFNPKDLEIARTKTKKYGEIYDHLAYYSNDLMAKMKVNVNDFNELYQKLYFNSLNKQNKLKEGKTLELKK